MQQQTATAALEAGEDKLARLHKFPHAGEHTIIMLSALQSDSIEGVAWLEPFVQDFRLRFTTLLPGAFKPFPPALALSILNPRLTFSDAEVQQAVNQEAPLLKADGSALSAYDFKRLQVKQSFSQCLCRCHVADRYCHRLFQVLLGVPT